MDKREYPTEIHLGKAAIYLAVIAVAGLIAGVAAQVYVLGFIGVLALIAAAGVGILHLRLMARMRR